MEDKIKKALKIIHDNNHSTSRIIRNIDLIKRKEFDFSTLDERLEIIKNSTLECRNQIDNFYSLLKEENGNK
jgi:hypothetical protein